LALLAIGHSATDDAVFIRLGLMMRSAAFLLALSQLALRGAPVIARAARS
jgi:hypothetical protein